MSLRGAVEAVFGPLHERESGYYHDITEHLLWADGVSSGGVPYRIAFLVREDEETEQPVFMMDFWWSGPVPQIWCGENVGLEDSRSVFCAEDASRLFEKIHQDVIPKMEAERATIAAGLTRRAADLKT